MPPTFSIVKDPDPNPRECFWIDFLQRLGYVGVPLILPSLLEQGKQPQINDHPFLVISWDVANGKLVHKSEKTQGWFRERQDRVNDFLFKGGVLILEAQCDKWKPLQVAYDSILGTSQVCVYSKKLIWSEEAFINSGFADHPLLFHVPNPVRSLTSSSIPAVWHPPGIATRETEQTTYPRKLYNGWFTKWNRSLVPLLFAHPKQDPILLCGRIGSGLLLVTTMYIASSGMETLVRNCVEQTQAIVAYHRELDMKRRIQRLTSMVVFLAVLFVIQLLLTLRWPMGVLPTGGNVGGQLVNLFVSTVGSLLATGLITLWKRFR